MENIERRYLPTLAELIDRMSISQLKEQFIPEHKEEYSKEISDIVHDIQICLEESKEPITAETIRAIVVLSQMNLHIWHNESNYRKGIKDGNNIDFAGWGIYQYNGIIGASIGGYNGGYDWRAANISTTNFTNDTFTYKAKPKDMTQFIATEDKLKEYNDYVDTTVKVI